MLQQLELETSALEEGKADYYKQLKAGGLLPPHVQLMKLGIGPLTAAIVEFLGNKKRRYVNGKFQALIADVPPEDLAYLTLWFVFTHPDMYVSLQGLSIALGKEIEDHLEFLRFRRERPSLQRAVQKKYRSANRGYLKSVTMLAKRRAGVADLKWTKEVHLHVGTTMLHLLVTSTGMFSRGVAWVNHHNNESPATLVPDPKIEKWLIEAHKRFSMLIPKHHVCVVPPKPWSNTTDGGFHSGIGSLRYGLVKTRSEEHLAEVESRGIGPMLNLVNALQSVAWKVNTRILDIAEVVWNLPGRMNVFAKGENVEFPAKKWETDEEWEKYKEEHPEEAKAWKRKMRDAYAAKQKAIKQLVQMSNTMGRARKYRDFEEFYFCWQFDWRGRIYPVQAHLTPQGDDLAKGLLVFKDGKPLGATGGTWLKIHLANCYGNKLDKKTFEERIAWVDQYTTAIIDSALYPIDGLRLWTEAEDPWQFLAAAMEYADWADSGFSEDFVSHIPVGVDGSCNGLQHLTTLMRDEKGGYQVNVMPTDEPQDIYSVVAEEVAKAILADLDNTEEWKDRGITVGELAASWNRKITRKLVKRPVMTLPYGVTSVGMRDQIVDTLMKSDKDELIAMVGFAETAYLVEKIRSSIGEVIKSASVCMDWFRKSASVFNRYGVQMSWTTPTGFFVKQQYWKSKMIRVTTYWGEQQVNCGMMTDSNKIDSTKQIGGSSPNIIHSLDASHLCMTVNIALRRGLRHFAMIHDSYGCHAGDIMTLNHCLRLAFVKLYSRDLLTDLKRQWEEVLPAEGAAELPEVPEEARGTMAPLVVLVARYFFA